MYLVYTHKDTQLGEDPYFWLWGTCSCWCRRPHRCWLCTGSSRCLPPARVWSAESLSPAAAPGSPSSGQSAETEELRRLSSERRRCSETSKYFIIRPVTLITLWTYLTIYGCNLNHFCFIWFWYCPLCYQEESTLTWIRRYVDSA